MRYVLKYVNRVKGTTETEEIELPIAVDTHPTRLMKAAADYLAPRNEGCPAWQPNVSLLSVTPVKKD